MWLRRLSERLLARQSSVVHVAKDLVHFLGSHDLFGGDVPGLIRILGLMVERTDSELGEIPTAEQRSAVVGEVAQSVVRAGSRLLETASIKGAWLDLAGGHERSEGVKGLLKTMQGAGRMVARWGRQNGRQSEATFASKNICKNCKI